MKKICFLLILCTCIFSGCNTNSDVSGKMIGTSTNDETELVSFVIQTDQGKEIGILLTDETHIFSFVDGMNAEDFMADPQAEVIVSVDYDAFHSSKVTLDNKEIKAYPANQIEIKGYLKDDSVRLSDGTIANAWQYSDAVAYLLQDGTELLRVRRPIGPNNACISGVESFDDLGETAQNRILAFYQRQGLLYDEQTELEKAYANYLRKEDASKFSTHMVSQETVASAANDSVIYFLTTVMLPIDGSVVTEYRISAAFDKTTGEYIDHWALFSCSPDEAIQKILDHAEITDSVLRKEIENTFDPEYMVFFPDHLEMSFPQGTLSSQEYGYILALDYDDGLSEILHDWAIPTNAA